MRIRKMAVSAVLVLTLTFLLTGCEQLREIIPGARLPENAQTEAKADGYGIYYTNVEATTLERRNYQTTATDFDGILNELIVQMQTPPTAEVISAFPSGVRITGCTMGVDNLTVDFNADYLSMNNVEEVLLRAAIVKTLTQLPGVFYVSITVDGQPLQESDGSTIGPMNEDTFIDVQGSGINTYHYMTVGLYFASSKGDKITRELRNIFYTEEPDFTKVIVEQIVRGPANSKLLPIVSPDVKVNSVTVSEGICTIDLSEEFLDTYKKRVKPESALYAIVNAVCDQCDNVDRVVFTVEGSQDVKFRDEISLNQEFERDATLIDPAEGTLEPETEVFLDGAEARLTARKEVEAQAAAADVTSAGTSKARTKATESVAETEAEPVKNHEDPKEAEAVKDAIANSGKAGVGVDPSLVEDN